MMYILIIVSGIYGGNQVHSVNTPFTSLEACEKAGDVIAKDFQGWGDRFKFYCVNRAL